MQGYCGGCASNSDCPTNQTCDTTYGVCTCRGNAGCGGDAPVCRPFSDAGYCGCAADSDCPSGQRCDLTNFYFGACVPNCRTGGGCDSTAPGPVCDQGTGSPTAGLCLQCLTNQDCTSAGRGSFCVSDFCTNCRNDADCVALDAGTPICAAYCVQCTQPGDCPAGQGCNGLTGQCGSCVWSSDCPDGKACTQDGQCATVCTYPQLANGCALCVFDADCQPDAGRCSPAGICGGPADGGIPGSCGSGFCAQGQVCDPSNNTCVECMSDLDCTNPIIPLCDPAAHACVQCAGPADCPLEFAGCGQGFCGRCASTADCPQGLTCGADQACHCSSNSDCGGSAPVCIPDGGVCGCTGNQDCGTGSLCDQYNYPYGSCVVPCMQDGGACYPNGFSPECDTVPTSGTYGLCLPCLSDTECQSAGSGTYCTPYGCGDCRNDSDCQGAASDAGPTPFCLGICVQCRDASDCANGAGCNSLYGTCGSCSADSDCPPSAPSCVNQGCQ